MNTFKRKTLNAAIAAGLGAMAVAGSAGAVQLSQDGTGQVLIYPYYTTRTAGDGDYNTYVNVVNTTKNVKAVKVRFLEGKNSREVLDFNLYLSPNDVWAAAVKPTTDGAELAVSAGSDKSCVSSNGGLYATVSKAGHANDFKFVNNAYTGLTTDAGVTTGWDGEDQTLDRTREGYIEIIEMGEIVNIGTASAPDYNYAGSTAAGRALAAGVTHNTAGVPANCGTIAGVSSVDFSHGSGGIMGGASIINVSNGSDFGYDPVVLEDFNTAATIWNAPGSIQPDMSSATNTSNVFYYHETLTPGVFETVTVSDSWGGGPTSVDAVSAVLMRNSVMNTYILDAATNSSTDWVVTFPTKRHYVAANNSTRADTGTPIATDPEGVVSLPPFTAGTSLAADAHFWTGGLCNKVSMQLWNREESTPATPADLEISPPPPAGPGATPNSLCWEANVITIANSAPALATDTLFGSKNGLAVTTDNEHGWAKLTFTDAFANIPAARNGGNHTYAGLPVVGFMAHDFINPNVTINGVPSASSYGGNFNHRFTRGITGVGVN